MKLQVWSDIHINWYNEYSEILPQLYTKCDVLVIPGDLNAVNPSRCLDEICNMYRDSMVLFVPGNHDFHDRKFEDTIDLFSEIEEDHENLKFLYNDTVYYQGVCFVGTTLWFKKPYDGFLHSSEYADFAYVPDFKNVVVRENGLATKFLDTALRGDPNAVVITHFMPSQLSVPPKYVGNYLNKYFVCEMDKCIEKNNPKMWIHGHTHTSADYVHPASSTRIVCNPAGYPNFTRHGLENELFDHHLIIEV